MAANCNENDREKERERERKKERGRNREKVEIYLMATESTSSSPLRSFRVESSPGHGPPIDRSNPAAASAALSLSLFLPPSPSPRPVASRGLTGEAGHLKYSSDAGLNEARPNVNLSTCFHPRILHSRRACWCLSMYVCV